jgi:hypothetical protein
MFTGRLDFSNGVSHIRTKQTPPEAQNPISLYRENRVFEMINLYEYSSLKVEATDMHSI